MIRIRHEAHARQDRTGRSHWRTVFRVSAMTVAGLAVSGLAQAIELTDYRDPNTTFDEAFVDFTANAQSGNQDQTSFNALFDAFYNARRSSDERVLAYRFDGFANASRGPNETDRSVDDNGLGAAVTLDQYFGGANDETFWFAAGDYAYRDSAVDDAIGVTAGVGYGRVWNATSLAKALRIQEVLSDIGVEVDSLADADLTALADIIAREAEYRSRDGADDYRGTWYADMEQVLNDAGSLDDGQLSALGTVKLDDVLFDEPISARRHGWLVRAGLGFQASDLSGLTDNDPKLTFQFEYAKPFGLRGQLIERATYEPVFGDNTVHSLENLLTYTYEVSDRIDWLNSWDFDLQQADDATDSRFIINTLSTTFLYHLTNQLDLGLTLAAIDVNQEPEIDDGNEELDTSVTLGLRYRLK